MRIFRNLPLGLLLLGTLSAQAQERSWVDLAVHNFGAPINTMWAEGELSFAADGTMVYCSARQDMAVAPGDPKDLYISTFNKETVANKSNPSGRFLQIRIIVYLVSALRSRCNLERPPPVWAFRVWIGSGVIR